MTRRKKWGIGGSAALLVLLVIFLFTTWPRDLLGAPLTRSEAPRRVDVVIVLGAGTSRKDPDHLPLQAKQRVLKGVELLNQEYADNLILAGGRSPSTGLVESDQMTNYAIGHGLNDSRVANERQSRNTWQNAELSYQIMEENDWTTALVVTSPYHTWRACRMFRVQHIDITCITAPYEILPSNDLYNRFMNNRSVIREYGAIILAWLKREI